MFLCKLITPFLLDILRDANEKNDDAVATERKVFDPVEQGRSEAYEGMV